MLYMFMVGWKGQKIRLGAEYNDNNDSIESKINWIK